jgi:hypothetical protein
LVTRAEAASVLGGPVTELTPVSPQRDEDTGAEQTGCVYQQGDGLGLAVVLLTFSSAEAAGASLTDEVAAQQLGDPDVTLVAEPGLADRAYWAASDDLAAYVVLRGRYVLGMSLGGDGFRGAAAHRGALRRAAEAAVRRL